MSLKRTAGCRSAIASLAVSGDRMPNGAGTVSNGRLWGVALGCLLWTGALAPLYGQTPDAPPRYVDDRFAFTVEYPPGWSTEIADENADEVPDYVMKRSIYFKSGGPVIFMVFVWSNREELDLVAWFYANYVDLMSYPDESPTAINDEILGQPALRFVNRQMTTCNMDIVLFQYGDWVYTLLYRNCDDGASKSLFEQFVASFRGGP